MVNDSRSIDCPDPARARPLLTEDDPSAHPFVDGGLDQLLDQTMLARAIQRFPPPHRQIVIETFFLGTPMHVTAARLGVPAGTVRSRLHYALSQLRRQVTAAGCIAA
ncbi:MAG: polymerase sigma-70 factor, subfamily [Actinoplanes sp.]|jgi:RNA polymerase sigma-70 factor (ECF subfamily)|nr:polymerase sigma-70 factor, subfamily [Pseudonocardiales bacterium]MDQ1752876.1 polymerase sigma-70 factor, subfamily [Pseudonocardiales bacterium]MDT5030498.1 polymerase sigma-70 factor, subfamily [Actinoplanes sp.]